MEDIRELAEVYVINVDTPLRSRGLKESTGITVPVLLDNGLKVNKSYDMHSRQGLPMGEMHIVTLGHLGGE